MAKPVPVKAEPEIYEKAKSWLLQLFSKLAIMKGYTNSVDYGTWISVVQQYLDKFMAGEVDLETVIREADKAVQETRYRITATQVATQKIST